MMNIIGGKPSPYGPLNKVHFRQMIAQITSISVMQIVSSTETQFVALIGGLTLLSNVDGHSSFTCLSVYGGRRCTGEVDIATETRLDRCQFRSRDLPTDRKIR